MLFASAHLVDLVRFLHAAPATNDGDVLVNEFTSEFIAVLFDCPGPSLINGLPSFTCISPDLIIIGVDKCDIGMSDEVEDSDLLHHTPVKHDGVERFLFSHVLVPIAF